MIKIASEGSIIFDRNCSRRVSFYKLSPFFSTIYSFFSIIYDCLVGAVE
jgi:hypothetical protein